MAGEFRKLLITGGNGNLGRLVARAFAARGIDVVRFDLPGTNTETTSARETLVSGDVRDADALAQLFETHKPDAVCHLASLLSGSSEADLSAAWEINATSSFRLMQLAVEHDVDRFFFASTFATYGCDVVDPLPEDAAQWPENIYGVTKVAVERLGAYFRGKNGLDFRCLRFPLVISPFAPRSAVTAYPSHAFRAAARGESFVFPVSPHVGVSTLFLDDVVSSIVAALSADPSHIKRPAYNLHAYFVSAQEVAETLKARFPGFSYTFVPDPAVERLLTGWPDVMVDATARADWGWAPAFDFPRSVDRMIELLDAEAS